MTESAKHVCRIVIMSGCVAFCAALTTLAVVSHSWTFAGFLGAFTAITATFLWDSVSEQYDGEEE